MYRKFNFPIHEFSEGMFYENYLRWDFHTNTVISRRVCLLVNLASITVIILKAFTLHLSTKLHVIFIQCHY